MTLLMPLNSETTMTENTIGLKPVGDLLGMNFFIPSYQRGYRWGKIQVTQLLDDLWDAYQESSKGDGSSWYCLQPLVVIKEVVEKEKGTTGTEAQSKTTPCGLPAESPSTSSKDGKWTVIDGQQRLTTLFLILKQLDGETLWTMKYETRETSWDFLKNVRPIVESEESNKNPDYWHIQKAANTVADWVEKQTPLKKPEAQCDFAKSIRDKAKFIWYEAPVEEDPYAVFTRLNSGKISLSNAELVKALLLQESRFHEIGGSAKLQQLEIAGEWDRIEQALHNDEFWYFINPEPESPRFNATRIDFLFEVVLRKGFPGQEEVKDYVGEIRKNPYFGFAQFAAVCKRNPTDPETRIWSEIQSVFRRIKSWYDNRSLYHYVGFLMNRKGVKEEARLGNLVDLLKISLTETHPGFLDHVKGLCSQIVIEGKKLDELEYGSDNSKLNDILLLFNLALLSRQDSEQSCYPFDLHVQKKWSLEHIHAQKERGLKEDEFEDLMRIYSIANNNNIIALNERLSADAGMQIIKTLDGEKRLVFVESTSNIKSDQSGAFVEILSGDDMLNSLRNLALLGGSDNSALNNKMYLQKKDRLSQWERSKEPHFVPIGTRMVFFKHFSPKSTLPLGWTVPDGDAYIDTIVKLVADYTGVTPEILISPSEAQSAN